MRFSDLRQKEVINCRDGIRLGFVADLEFEECSGRIIKIIVPGPGRFCGCIGRISEYCIEYCQIVKIGADLIIVDIDLKEALIKCKD